MEHLVYATWEHNSRCVATPPDELQLLSLLNMCQVLNKRFDGYLTGHVSSVSCLQHGLIHGLIGRTKTGSDLGLLRQEDNLMTIFAYLQALNPWVAKFLTVLEMPHPPAAALQPVPIVPPALVSAFLACVQQCAPVEMMRNDDIRNQMSAMLFQHTNMGARTAPKTVNNGVMRLRAPTLRTRVTPVTAPPVHNPDEPSTDVQQDHSQQAASTSMSTVSCTTCSASAQPMHNIS